MAPLKEAILAPTLNFSFKEFALQCLYEACSILQIEIAGRKLFFYELRIDGFEKGGEKEGVASMP